MSSKNTSIFYISAVQKECDISVENWNSHRIKEQIDLCLPTGFPNHMFSCPDNYGGTKDSFQVSVDLLREVAKESEVLQENKDFLEVPLNARLRDLIQHPEKLKPTETLNVFLYLKKYCTFS